ncbi:MAG: hypothetical protein ACI9Y1_003099, partial [Lentisphaeria bacterium]
MLVKIIQINATNSSLLFARMSYCLVITATKYLSKPSFLGRTPILFAPAARRKLLAMTHWG